MAPKPNGMQLPESVPNPSCLDKYNASGNGTSNGNNMKLRVPMERRYVRSTVLILGFMISDDFRYYAKTAGVDWPPEVRDYNSRFTKILDTIKRRHDPTVATVAQGVLEWKRSQNARNIGLDIQAWLDRFYMSRIGIRFLIGQRKSTSLLSLALV